MLPFASSTSIRSASSVSNAN